MNQPDLFNAETNWFHLFKSMVLTGEVAKMGPYAFTVYCVIKAHSNFNTGESFPSVETIASKSGVSAPQVKRELVALEKLGYLLKEKPGRSNVYKLREKININDASGLPAAIATWDYLPNSVQAAVADLRNVLLTGDLAGAKIVHIENLTVNMNINNGSGVQNNFVDLSKISDPKLREQMSTLMEKVASQASDPASH